MRKSLKVKPQGVLSCPKRKKKATQQIYRIREKTDKKIVNRHRERKSASQKKER